MRGQKSSWKFRWHMKFSAVTLSITPHSPVSPVALLAKDDSRPDEGGLELEKTIIANNSNPFIVDMHYALQTENCAILVLGLVGGGDLSDLIQSSPHKKLPESLAAIYTYEISLALKHLHTNGVVYRDLKPSNILVDDFGH